MTQYHLTNNNRNDRMILLFKAAVLLSLYVFLFTLYDTQNLSRTLVTRSSELMAFVLLFGEARRLGLSKAQMGLRWDNRKEAFGGFLRYTLGTAALMCAAKTGLLLTGNEAFGNVLFSGKTDITYLTYLGVAFFQEFLARGAAQSLLVRAFGGRKGPALMICSLIFGLMHLHYSPLFALGCFGMGILWGLLYEKYPNLYASALSHFLIGNLAGLLGFC